MLRLIRVLAVFVGGTVLSYVLVLVAAFTFWSFVPTPDPTKQIAATVFLIVGPALALVGGLWLATWAATGRAPWIAAARERRAQARLRAQAVAARGPRLTPNVGERVVGWLFVALGGGGIGLGLAGLAAIQNGDLPWVTIPAVHLVPVFVLAVVGILGPALLGGIGLLRGAVSGRPVVTVTAILMLFLPPVGTLAGLVALVVLHGKRFGRKEPARGSGGHGAWGQGAPITCAHLAPIVDASLAAGLAVTHHSERRAQVHATAYPPLLQRLLPEGSPVVFETWAAPERSHLDPPRLVLRCTACDAQLAFDAPVTAPPAPRDR